MSSARRRSTLPACWLLSLALLGIAGCSAHKPRVKTADTEVNVKAGAAVTVADTARHLTVSAAPDVIPPGKVVIAAPRSDVADGMPVRDAVSIIASGVGLIKGEIELRFQVPDSAPMDATIAYYEQGTHKWLPVPSRRNDNDLIGTTSHLTKFGWFDDVRLVLGQMAGTRAAAPTCTGTRPDWLRNLITTQGADAQVLACGETSGDDLKVTVVNNRSYPVALELSTPPTSSSVGMSWPTGVRDLLDRMLASLEHNGTSVALPALGTVTLTYPRPNRPTIVTGYVRVGLPAAVLTVLTNGILDTGLAELDVTLGGRPLGLSTLDCLASATSGTHDLLSLDANRIAGVVQKFAGCVLGILDAEREAILFKGGSDERFTRLSRARDVFKVYTVLRTVEQLAEVGLDERADIRNGVDLTLDLDPGPITVGGNYVGPFTLGMRVDQVRAAAGVSLDHDDYCGFYTFHGEKGFGDGDGPTFFFDDVGHLRGMLVGRSVFHRTVRTDHSARIGTTLAELQKGYGAALVPPGHADSPNLAWVKGPSGSAVGFEMDQTGRVAGFRVGVEGFVTALEFCG